MNTSGRAFLMTALAIALFGRSGAAQPGAKEGRASAKASAPLAYGPWRSCKIGGGGYIQNVVLCPSDPRRVYAYVDVGGLYRSDDGGERWRMLHGHWDPHPGSAHVRGLLVDPRDADRLIVAVSSSVGKGGLLVSRDGGETWRMTRRAAFFGNGPHRADGVVLARHPRRPDTVLAAAIQTGVWRSDDNGETWRQGGARNLDPMDLRYDPANPDRLWLCALSVIWGKGLPDTFLRSDDGGATWRKLAGGSPNEVLPDPTAPGRLLGLFDGAVKASMDGGETWLAFSEGLPAWTPGSGNSFNRFKALAAGPDFLVAASTMGEFYRLDRGQTVWRHIECEGVERHYEGEEWALSSFGLALGSIVVDPLDADHWFFTDWFAIYQTHDAGRHWRLTINGIEVTCVHSLLQDPTDPAVVHLGMADNGYFYSETGGERFSKGRYMPCNVKWLALSPALPNRVYAVGCRDGAWESNQVFVSIDRGLTWRRSPMRGLPDMDKHHSNSIAADPKNPYLVYLALSGEVGPNAGGVYRSRDGGRTWRWMGQGLPAGAEAFEHSIWGVGGQLAIGPDGTLLAMTREKAGLYRLDPSSETWFRLAPPIPRAAYAIAADPARRGRYWLAASDGIYRTDDSGGHWRRALAVVDRADWRGWGTFVAVDAARPDRVAAEPSDGLGVALSEDGGETWRRLDARLPHRIGNRLAFAGERLLVATGGSGAFWTPLNPAGEQPVTAKPVVRAELPVQAEGAPVPVELPKLANPDFSVGGETPSAWHSWTGYGKLKVKRDPQVFHDPPASITLCAEDGAAYGSVSQSFPVVAGSSFVVKGFCRARGGAALKECGVAMRVYDGQGKQLSWLSVARVRADESWQEFARPLDLTAAAKRCQLNLTLRGQGQVWLDEISFAPAPEVFLSAPEP